MKKSNIEITQFLLDRSLPGRDAVTELSNWGIDILRNTRNDVRLLTSVLYDGFGQANFTTRDDVQKGYINKTDFLMKEVLFRYLSKVLGHEFIERSGQVFQQAADLVNLNLRVKHALSAFEKKDGFDTLRQGANATLESIAPLINDVYLMGEAKRLLNGEAGSRVRELYYPTPSQPPYSERSVRFPAFEAIGKKMDDAQKILDLMDDQELTLRLLRSFSATKMAEYDTKYPVYGVKTIYAYMPLIVDRLLNGWTYDNQSVMDDLAVSMDEASSRLIALQGRLERMHQADCERQVDYLAERYGDGECAVFAVALNQITDLPVVVFNVTGESNDPALPVGFPRHAAVQAGPDQYLDGCGLSSLKDISTRLGCQLSVKADEKHTAPFFESDWVSSAFDNPDIIEARAHAKEMLQLRDLRNLLSFRAMERLERHEEYGM